MRDANFNSAYFVTPLRNAWELFSVKFETDNSTVRITRLLPNPCCEVIPNQVIILGQRVAVEFLAKTCNPNVNRECSARLYFCLIKNDQMPALVKVRRETNMCKTPITKENIFLIVIAKTNPVESTAFVLDFD